MITAIPIRMYRKRAGPFVLLALALCVVVACVVGGCKDEPPTPRQVTKKVVSAPDQVPVSSEPKATEPVSEPPGTLPPGPLEAKPEDSVFRPKSERDPFKSFVTTRTKATVRTGNTPRIKTPLQRYSLDQLKVVGIIAGGKMRKALLEDDVGKGYVVSPGDAVGREGGKIASIQKDCIIIESTYRDVLGNQKVRRITKKLYVSEEGENP
jgi:type IV pilus assembly protein PilP